MKISLNLIEMLKDCPKGTSLYSTIYGAVSLVRIEPDEAYPIVIEVRDDNGLNDIIEYSKDGKFLNSYKNSEVTLFPSCENRDWATFNPKKIKFDPNTLNPFDKVLVRNVEEFKWKCDIFSYICHDGLDRFVCVGCDNVYCIPYNDKTKHLVGTTEEAPEFYRYWED
ncbi:MAG: hypothetical protein ACI36Z_03195 [Alloprevotella sp.]